MCESREAEVNADGVGAEAGERFGVGVGAGVGEYARDDVGAGLVGTVAEADAWAGQDQDAGEGVDAGAGANTSGGADVVSGAPVRADSGAAEAVEKVPQKEKIKKPVCSTFII